jgi:hypothetical protein
MRIVYFLALILISFLVRFQEVSKGLPYFYDEDEAHHFNRVVSMVQRGTFDPEYFHKPSLHFYLRMPVVAASFLWNVKEGHLKSINDIVIKNKEGVGGYSFSASHPGIVKWNRMLSLVLSLAAIIIVYLIAINFELPPLIASITALLCGASPALISYSSVIGVDVLVVFFCLLSTYFALLNLQSRTETFLLLSSIAAGLAVGSKYNALPIVLVPMFTALMGVSGLAGFIWAGILAGITFLITTPFLFAHIPLFLDHLAYEIWHYKIAGHEGHSAEPGLAQAKFFFNFFTTQGLSLVVVLTSIIGLVVMFKTERRKTFILALFPVVYFLLMIDQRTNFTRNMLVVIPYLALFACIGVSFLFRRLQIAQLILALTLLITVAPKTFAYLNTTKLLKESRNDLLPEIKSNPNLEYAIDHRLQVASNILNESNVSEAPLQTSEFLYLKGFDKYAQMSSSPERIIKNPTINLINLNESIFTPELKRDLANRNQLDTAVLTLKDDKFTYSNASGDLCWLNTRLGSIQLKDLTNAPGFSGINGVISVNIKLFSLWDQDSVKISFSDFLADIPIEKLEGGKEKEITLNLPYQELKDQQGFYISFNKIRRPSNPTEPDKIRDSRRLGLAILSFSINRR